MGHSPLTIMLVEDDALIALDLVDALEAAGYEVLGPFTKTSEALRLLQQRPPSLAILDPLLREGFCVDLAGELRRRGVPFLVHSSLQQDEPLANGFRGVPWLMKPVLPSALIHVVRELARSVAAYARDPRETDLIPAPWESIPTSASSNPFVRKLEGFASLSDADRAMLERISAHPRTVAPATTLIEEGDEPRGVYLVMSGIACRYKQRADGTRQITALLLPGDTCDLDVALLDELDHAITTLSTCSVVRIPFADMRDLVGRHPTIAKALRISTLADEATLREWLVNLGCRSAIERIAHLFCEVLVRLHAVGLATEDTCELPLTQSHIADTTGVTAVHVNRSLKELRRRGLIELHGRTLKILDGSGLKALGEFKANYLHLKNRAVA